MAAAIACKEQCGRLWKSPIFAAKNPSISTLFSVNYVKLEWLCSGLFRAAHATHIASVSFLAVRNHLEDSYHAYSHSRRDGCRRHDPYWLRQRRRSEEHTSELQSLMRISYAVFCLTKKKPQ